MNADILGKSYKSFISRTMLFAALALVSLPASSKTFFEEDFESGTVSTSPQPVWSWPAPDETTGYRGGMMFGDGDIYTVSSERVHSGAKALKLTFDGRNNFCNICGASETTVQSSDLSSGCLSISGSAWNGYVYNKSDGFSTWNVTSYNSSTICLDMSKAINTSLLGGSSIKAGDTIKVPYLCGTNGTVGGNIDRRSDCNKAINYLNGISSSDFPYGKQLSRRFYIYIPSATTLPGTTLKLGYVHFTKGGSTVGSTLKLSVQRDLQLELSAPGGKSSPDYYLAKDQWYYFEEVFTRESADGVNDGKYELYVNKDGGTVAGPVFSQSNIQIGQLKDMSFNGNFQHYNDAKGSVYFDDIIFSDGFVGPSTGEVIPPPNPPSSITVE